MEDNTILAECEQRREQYAKEKNNRIESLTKVLFKQIETLEGLQSRNEDCPEAVIGAARCIVEIAALIPSIF